MFDSYSLLNLSLPECTKSYQPLGLGLMILRNRFSKASKRRIGYPHHTDQLNNKEHENADQQTDRKED